MPHSAAFHLGFYFICLQRNTLKSPVESVNRNMSLIRFCHVLRDVFIENHQNPYCQNFHIMFDINKYFEQSKYRLERLNVFVLLFLLNVRFN